MAAKIIVDCIHNAGRIVISSSRHPDMAFNIAKSVYERLNCDNSFQAEMPERDCVKKYGTDSMRGRISIANSINPDCYICFHSNPSGRHRQYGIAAHIKSGDKVAGDIAQKILNAVDSETAIKPLGVFESSNAYHLAEAPSAPIILELVFNPYSDGYTPFRDELSKLPDAVYSGLKAVFDVSEDLIQPDFQEFLTNNPGTGYIKVQVLAGRSAVPVTDARIVISKTIGDNKYVLADLTSDMNGMTNNVSLPAPPAQLSQEPGNLAPYASYDIEVSHPRYMSQTDLNVPVFEKILSIQNVRLNSANIDNGENNNVVEESQSPRL